MKKTAFLFILVSVLFAYNISFSQIPAPPTNLKFGNIFSSALSLKWDDNSYNESGFILERSINGKQWININSMQPNTTSYIDVGLQNGTRYYYRIYAFNSSGKSSYSNIIYADPTPSYDCSVGNDTISTPYPFYTTYTDSRTQILYRKSEMVGYCSVGTIWTISFYCKLTSGIQVSNVTIKMKSTNETILTKFIDSGLTVVYNNYPLYINNGLLCIFLNPVFTWDVNKNLLIEICYHLQAPLANNMIFSGTAAQNKVWHRHKQSSNGCTLDSGTVLNIRPNFRMNNIIDGVRKISTNIPQSFSIEQNYPNPFNGETKFRFKIKDFSPVTLSIYDVLGRQEVVVFSEPLSPGEYEKSFSLSDHQLPSGIYYYCFVARDFIIVKKLVVLK